MKVSVGRPLQDVMCIAYHADQPVLLWGHHGVGKSEMLELVAGELGIDSRVVDLSLLEPPDLIGLPRVAADGRTHYAPPAILPEAGKGLLVLEELNRCPIYMRAPALQLLTARRLNDYELPRGWLPVAAANPIGDDYLVDNLDPALRSRFLEVTCEPATEEWLRWARAHGVNRLVVELVEATPTILTDRDANPRALASAGRLLDVAEAVRASDETIATVLTGVLKRESWAVALMRLRSNCERPLPPAAIIDNYRSERALIARWVSAKRIDLLKTTLVGLQHHLEAQRIYVVVTGDPAKKLNVESFFGDLPAELRRQVRDWLCERRFQNLKVAPDANGSMLIVL